MTLPSLTPVDLVLAGLFALLWGALSLAAGIGGERAFVLGFLRMVAQLGLWGLVLKFVFEQSSVGWALAAAVAMLALAVWESARGLAGRAGWVDSAVLSSVTLAVVGCLATLLACGALVGATPWYAPQIALPLLGMVLGTALSALNQTLVTLTDAIARERPAIEMRLALGQDRLTALSGPLRTAIETGLAPVLGGLGAAGAVVLPGLMTGQIIAGVDPIEAAKYQIMILAVLAGATALAVGLGAAGGVWLVTDNRQRLRPQSVPRVPVPRQS